MNNESPGKKAWRRFRKNKTALGGLWLILLTSLTAIFCYSFIPDHTPAANRMCLQAGNQPPGFSVKMIRLPKPEKSEFYFKVSNLFTGTPDHFDEIAVNNVYVDGMDVIYEEYSMDSSNGSSSFRIPLVNAVYALSSQLPVVEGETRITLINIEGKKIETSKDELKSIFLNERVFVRTYWLGTDRYGRDLLSRLLAGAQVTFSVGMIAVLISLLIGTIMGSLAGFFRGWVDRLVLWLINVTWSIPTLLLVIAITLVLGKGFEQVFIAVGLTMWVDVARMVRSQLFSIRETEFVLAGQVMGFRNFRIILRHMLPNIIGPVLVVAASNFSTAILLESGLSFLGIGAQPPTPSWGTMIKENYGYIIIPGSAYLAILPGIAIMLLTMAFTFVANGLRDAIDSRQQVSVF